MSILSELRPYMERLVSLPLPEILRIVKVYGMAVVTEAYGMPETGEGVVTTSLYLKRKAACAACPLLSNSTCNPGKSRPHVSEKNADGTPRIVKGCGCSLWAKHRSFSDHCPAGEW